MGVYIPPSPKVTVDLKVRRWGKQERKRTGPYHKLNGGKGDIASLRHRSAINSVRNGI